MVCVISTEKAVCLFKRQSILQKYTATYMTKPLAIKNLEFFKLLYFKHGLEDKVDIKTHSAKNYNLTVQSKHWHNISIYSPAWSLALK